MKKTITALIRNVKMEISGFRKAGALLAFAALMTGGQLNAQTIQVGSGTGSSTNIPLYYLYNYNYNQTIYTSAEIIAEGGQSGTITKIKYKPKSSVSTEKWKDLVIYMANTVKDSFSSTTDWVPLAELTQVFSGELSASVTANQWVEITLDTPFTWDSTKNLVIAVDENTPGYGNNPSWSGYSLVPGAGSKTIYKYQDGSNIDPASPPSGTVANIAAQIQFEGGIVAPQTTPPPCTTISAPADSATGVSITPTISWTSLNTASGYIVNVGTTPGGSDVVSGVEVTTNSYSIPSATPLNYSTTYYVTVLPKNTIGPATGCTEVQFTTLDIPCPAVTAPSNSANAQSLTPTITWNAVNGATGYTVTVGSSPGGSDIVGGVDVGANTSYTFTTPLANSTTYYYTINAYSATSVSSSCSEKNFTTVCNPYTIPYFEGFESGYVHDTTVSGCLAQVGVSGSNLWTPNNLFVDYNRTPRTGAWNAFLKYGTDRWLFIPVQLTAGVAYRFTAYARQDGSNANNVNVTVAYGDAATAAAMTNTIVTPTGIVNGDYQKITGNFVPATSGTYFVGIKGYLNSSPWYLSIDDISIDLAPNCLEPYSISATGSTTSSVDVSWVAPGIVPTEGYDIYYSTSNVAPDANTAPLANVPNTQTTYTTPNDLMPQTQYYVWVRSKCSSSESSSWTGPTSIYTLCSSTTVPYTMDFETATVPNLPFCTSSQNAGAGNNWVVENNPGSGFTNKTLKYKFHSANAANAWFYTQGINLVAGQTYTIAFSYGNNSTTFAEKLKVAYGTSNDVASMINQIVDLPNINQNAKQNFTMDFVVPSTGVYYFGFNAYSDKDKYNLYVDDISITVSTMGTNEIANSKDNVKIYPNPFSEVLSISDVRDVKSISITDASGRLVKTIVKPTSDLQLGELKSGLYLLNLHYKDGSVKSFKAIKK